MEGVAELKRLRAELKAVQPADMVCAGLSVLVRVFSSAAF